MSKPREFWLLWTYDEEGYVLSDHIRCIETGAPYEYHVIEKWAYAKLEEENKKLRESRQQLRDALSWYCDICVDGSLAEGSEVAFKTLKTDDERFND